MTDRPRADVARGPILAPLLGLAIPAALAQLLSFSTMLINRYWIGGLSTESLAAVGLCSSLLPLLSQCLMWAALGAQVVIARRVGAGDREEAAAAAGQGLWMGMVLSLVVGLGGALLARTMMGWLIHDEGVIREGAGFLQILMVGTPTSCLLFTALFSLHGAGEARVPLKAMLLVNLLNILLDPLLIYGWGPFPALGLPGAGWATVLAQGAGAGYALAFLFSTRGPLPVSWESLRPRRALSLLCARVGIPAVAEMVVRSLAALLLAGLVSRAGAHVSAGHTTGFLLVLFLFLPCIGIGQGAATLVGQSLGAGETARARKAGWMAAGLASSLGLVLSGCFYILAPSLLGWFDSHPDTIAAGTEMIRLICPAFVFSTGGVVLGRAMLGAGATAPVFWLTTFCLLFAQVGLALWWDLGLGMGPRGVWWAMFASNLLQAAAMGGWYLRGSWLKTAV